MPRVLTFLHSFESGGVERVALRRSAGDDASVSAWLGSGFPVKISSCESGWCAVSAADHPPGGPVTTYNGYLREGDLWGVYRGESFD